MDEGIKGAQVGKPITAKDDDTASLLYSLELADDTDTGDVDESKLKLFGINTRTGQITTNEKLDSDDADSDATTNRTYTVMVTATDPSGADETVDVVITVNDVNDAPMFDTEGDDAAPKTLWVNENELTKPFGRVMRLEGTEVEATAYGADDDDTADTDRHPRILFGWRGQRFVLD